MTTTFTYEHVCGGADPAGIASTDETTEHDTDDSLVSTGTARPGRARRRARSLTKSRGLFYIVEPVFGGLWARNVSIGRRAVVAATRERDSLV